MFKFPECSNAASGVMSESSKTSPASRHTPLSEGKAETGLNLFRWIQDMRRSADSGYKGHCRVKHGEDEFAERYVLLTVSKPFGAP